MYVCKKLIYASVTKENLHYIIFFFNIFNFYYMDIYFQVIVSMKDKSGDWSVPKPETETDAIKSDQIYLNRIFSSGQLISSDLYVGAIVKLLKFTTSKNVVTPSPELVKQILLTSEFIG